MTQIRQPIVTVAGHVDHGKTSLLDSIRGTKIAEKEAGGITQKISFTAMPKEIIKERAGQVIDKFKIPLEIPGFLFIDTPGHAAFTNLRKRGGSLADIAILVIDVNEGIKPQTAEVLQILKANKTPFIVALNKIDNISGWQQGKFFYENLSRQGARIQQEFDEKFYTIVGALNSYGFNPELYYKISDFTKNLAVVPCSARTGEGIPEIIAVLCALSQKFLKQRIAVKEIAKGVVLEIKKERVPFIEAILYDGSLKLNDEIIIASFGKPIIAKIRSIQEALPLSKGYRAVEQVSAAAGIKIQLASDADILSGMPFQIAKNTEEVEKEFSKEISEGINTDETGICIKAESLGSLEALITLLHQKQIPVLKADIGPITKKDLLFASGLQEQDKVILAFNVSFDEGVEPVPGIKVIENEVVYKLIEDLEDWRAEKAKELERQKLEELPRLVKITILPFVFRNSNPAIFGVRVDAGRLVQDIDLINKSNIKIGHVKAIQHEKNNIKEAEKGKEIAMSVPGVTFDRQLEKGESLYSNLSETQFRKFKEHRDLLTEDEKKVLMEIAEIKRRQNVSWGV